MYIFLAREYSEQKGKLWSVAYLLKICAETLLSEDTIRKTTVQNIAKEEAEKILSEKEKEEKKK
jgi:hypothetical protein